MSINSYYYLGLGLFSLVLLTYTWLKSGSSRSLILFLIMVGFGYLVEGVIYALLGSYQYIPMLIKHDAFYDSNLGAIASNALALPVTATCIAVFRLGWVWIVAFTLLFVGIEWLFLHLNIYIHYWWKLGYTAFSLPFYYLFAKALYRRILHPVKGLVHFLTLALILGAIVGTLDIFPIMFFENRYYELGWYGNRGRETTAFSFIYFSCSSLIMIVLIGLKWKLRWLKYVLMMTFVYVVTLIFIQLGLLHSLVWWDQPYYVLLAILVLWIGSSVSKSLRNGPIGIM